MYIIFGASKGAEIVIKKNRDKFVKYVVDNDEKKWGTLFLGYEVKNPKTLINEEKSSTKIMVASSFYSEIKTQLKEYGYIEDVHFWDELFNINNSVLNQDITQKIEEIINRKLFEITTNLSFGLQLDALKNSVNFIKEHLLSVEVFDNRLDLLGYALSKVENNLDLYLEFGVFEGESINYISKKIYPKMIYGFDSFEGLPENWRPGFDKGTFRLENLPKTEKNTSLVKGWFNETLPKFLEENNNNCAFIHIDCDLYSSTVTVLNLLKGKIVKGTIIVFDEFYNYPNWEHGEFKALSEFAESNKISFDLIGINRLGSQVAIKIK